MSDAVRPFYVMAKPVCGVCNLRCSYCYYLDKPRELYPGVTRFQMSDEVLESYTRQYLALMPVQASFGWQGGEPLLAGKEFFRKAVELQERLGAETATGPAGTAPQGGDGPPAPPPRTIANALQTNGTLLDEEWCEFLARYKFLVGLSLDGPPAWHDHFRRDPAGGSAFARAWAGLELLRQHAVEFNVLVTLNSRNAPHAGDIYRYFVNRGLRWLQFIPVLERDANGRPTEFSCSPKQFGRFMLDVLELWLDRHVGVVSERLIDSVLHTLVHGQAALCCNSERCANAYVLEHNGNLFACDHFVYHPWLLGNILQTPLAELISSPKLEEFARLKTELPAACRDCEFLAYCRGGCPKHHLLPRHLNPSGPPDAGERFDPGAGLRDPARVNYFCEGYKLFFHHALPALKRVAAHIQRGQPAASVPPAVAPAPQSEMQAGPRRPALAPGRNDPCPCGSGRKFKHCCGR